MKRSLGPRYWQRPVQVVDRTPVQSGLTPLVEGPALRPVQGQASVSHQAHDDGTEASVVKPYGRGSLDLAIQAAQSGPQHCAEHIAKRARATTSHGPYASRERTWESIAMAAGFTEPFAMSPDLIYSVMGAMDKAGYRSAELYMEVAKQRFISEGGHWSSQLVLAAKLAKRACQRGRGPAKQAQPLPLSEVAALRDGSAPLACGGPEFAIRATLLASWWLLREIEASNALLEHIQVDTDAQVVNWRLPSSKADWRALGATRTHTCACSEQVGASLCPYHLMMNQINWARRHNSAYLFFTKGGQQTTKAGWAALFEAIAKQLKLEIIGPTGLRKFTGHSARASGAVHMARTQIELWRIQLFGRWGSEIFKQYVRDAPLEQLHSLAQEVSLKASLAAAKAELTAILETTREAQAVHTCLAKQPVSSYMDCEAAAQIEPPVPPPATNDIIYVRNRAQRGKVHLGDRHGDTLPHYLWRTKCSWYFARGAADYALLPEEPAGPKCSKCFTHPEQDESEGSSSSTTSLARSSES